MDQHVVVITGLVKYNNKYLIIKRNSDMEMYPNQWGFPGGKVDAGEDLFSALKREIKEETGLEVESLGTIFARVYPEKEEFLAIYYLCEKISGEEVSGDNFTELKWVEPEELENYFTTSFHPKLKEYLMNLK